MKLFKGVFSAGFKRYFTNTYWLMLERGVQLGVAFSVGVYVARYLGPANFGRLTFIQKSGHVDNQKCYLKEKEDRCLKDVFAVVMTGSSNS